MFNKHVSLDGAVHKKFTSNPPNLVFLVRYIHPESEKNWIEVHDMCKKHAKLASMKVKKIMLKYFKNKKCYLFNDVFLDRVKNDRHGFASMMYYSVSQMWTYEKVIVKHIRQAEGAQY